MRQNLPRVFTYLFFTACAVGCTVLKGGWMNSQRGSTIAGKLAQFSYSDLFMQMETETLDALWAEPDAASALHHLVQASDAPPPVAFLAAEILFAKEPGYPPSAERERLASIYGAALEQNLTRMANPWGLPDQLDEPVAQHFVSLGENAVPVLTRLLENTSGVRYGGSREATYGNSFQYRVKDLAAFYLSKIRGLPYEIKQTPQERDIEIERLKTSLK